LVWAWGFLPVSGLQGRRIGVHELLSCEFSVASPTGTLERPIFTRRAVGSPRHAISDRQRLPLLSSFPPDPPIRPMLWSANCPFLFSGGSRAAVSDLNRSPARRYKART